MSIHRQKSFLNSRVLLQFVVGFLFCGSFVDANELNQKAYEEASHHVLVASQYSLEGRSELAIEEYMHALLRDPNSSEIYTKLSLEYAKVGRGEKALESAKKALDLNPKNYEVSMLLGHIYTSFQFKDKALVYYQKAQKIRPHDSEAFFMEAALHLESSKPSLAFALLRDKKEFIEQPVYWLVLGQIYEGLHQSMRAQKAYEKSLELKINFTQARLALYKLLKKTSSVQALRLLEEGFEVSADSSIAQEIASEYLAKEQFVKALPYLEYLSQQDSVQIDTKIKLGLTYLQIGHYDKARESFERVLQEEPEADRVKLYISYTYFKENAPEQAFKMIESLNTSSEVFQEGALQAAIYLKEAKKTDEAFAWIHRVENLGTATPNLLLVKASLFDEQKRYEEAEIALQTGLSIQSSHSGLLYYLGIIQDKQKKYQESENTMEKLLETDPQHVQALNYLGYNLAVRHGEYLKSLKYLHKAVRLKAHDPYLLDSLGYVYLKIGRVSDAVRILETSLEKIPHETVVLEHLGEAYLKSGMPQKAISMYMRALEAAPLESKNELQAKVNALEGKYSAGRSIASKP